MPNRRGYGTGGSIVAAIGLSIAIALWPAPASAAPASPLIHESSQAGAKRDRHEVLRGELRALASHGISSRERLGILGALVTRRRPSGAEIAVSIRVEGVAGPGVLARLVRSGASIANVGSRTVEAYVAPDRLSDLASLRDVRSVVAVRPIHPAYVSPAVALHGASTWQAAGFTGTGIRVGIIDGGFSGLLARVGSELPANIHPRCYTAVGSFSADLAACENGEIHGTAVAETIADMAPGVELYIADPISSLDEQQTVAWMTSNGVRVVNASWASGYIFDGPGDGTSPYDDSTYALVDQAVAGGALWVNSAGNEGETGWTGSWADADGDGWLEWAGGDERNSLTLTAGESIVVAIRWADPWGASSNDYDLQLLQGSATVASSEDAQAGAGDPYEILEYTAPAAGSYDVAVVRIAGAPTSRIQMLAFTGPFARLRYQVPAGTLPAPADSANPGMVTVGAVNAITPGTVEPYSSRGPTLDGRIRPDLVAIDCAPTTVAALFCGTSESAPFVTGAAALRIQANPGLTPAQLAAELRSHAVPLGSPVPNATSGWGRLDLGSVPAAPAAALAFASPPTGAIAGEPLTGQPTIRIVDAGGRTVSAGPSSTATVTLALGWNPTGATLACGDALTRAAVAGVANFSGCSVDRPGPGYTIRASVPDLPPIVSAPFDILAPGSSLPLGLAASASTLTWPADVTLAGQFSAGLPGSGRSIEFQSSSDGVRWIAAGAATTDAGGLAWLSNQPKTTAWYRAFFGGAADLPAATSYPVRITVRQALTLSASIRAPRTIAIGRTVTFTSTVGPSPTSLSRPTVTFVVYRRVGTTWVLFRRVDVVTDSTGRARFAWRFSRAGSWYVRSMAKATPSVAASAWSPVARYDVR